MVRSGEVPRRKTGGAQRKVEIAAGNAGVAALHPIAKAAADEGGGGVRQHCVVIAARYHRKTGVV